jgi:hypothetical protein
MSSTTIKIDKVRHLRYTVNARADIEAELGVPFHVPFSILQRMSYRDARVLLWGGLKHEDPELRGKGGVIKAGDLIDVWEEKGGTLDTLYMELIKAVKNDVPSMFKVPTKEEIEEAKRTLGELIGGPTSSPTNGSE